MQNNHELNKFYKTLKFEINKDEPFVVNVKLSKDQLISPALKRCIDNSFFNDTNKIKYNFFCYSDFYLNEEETLKLLDNYKKIKSINGELYFEEVLKESFHNAWHKKFKKLLYLDYETAIYRYDFNDIMYINGILYSAAKKINSGYIDDLGKTKHFTPFEKYMLCYKIVKNIPYYIEDGNNDSSQSFVETVKRNKGCCAGKSKYLTALLKWVGIDSCEISVSSHINSCFILSSIKKSLEKAIFKTSNLYHDNYKLHNENKMTDATWLLNETDILLNEKLKDLKRLSVADKNLSDHKINLVYIDDDKYGIHGVFGSDTTVQTDENDFSPQIQKTLEKCTGFIELKAKDLDSLLSQDGPFESNGKNIIAFSKKISGSKLMSFEQEKKIEHNFLNSLNFMLLYHFDKLAKQNNVETTNNHVLKQFRSNLACPVSFSSLKNNISLSLNELRLHNLNSKNKGNQNLDIFDKIKYKIKHFCFNYNFLQNDKNEINNKNLNDDYQKIENIFYDFANMNDSVLKKLKDALDAKKSYEQLPQAQVPTFNTFEKIAQLIDYVYELNFDNNYEKIQK